MRLRGAEHDRLLALVDHAHEELDAVRLAFLDLDKLVEILLFVALARLDVALDHLVIRGVDVVVQRGGDLPHLKRREKAVVDAVLQRIDEHRLAEVVVGVGVDGALGGGGQAELHGRREVVEYGSP
jgi:hypothetical protein